MPRFVVNFVLFAAASLAAYSFRPRYLRKKSRCACSRRQFDKRNDPNKHKHRKCQCQDFFTGLVHKYHPFKVIQGYVITIRPQCQYFTLYSIFLCRIPNL